MTKPAVRVGDPTAHGTPLGPSPGAQMPPAVIIENKPAFRTVVDFHTCPMPIAPPAPAPHAAEACYKGSFSVLINNQMAMRMGDMLMGPGPPNSVVVGALRTFIGDIAMGLLDPNNIAEFCADMRRLANDWPTLNPQQRRQRLGAAVNKQLVKSGTPKVKVKPKDFGGSGRLGELDFQTWQLDIDKNLLNSPTLAGNCATLANTAYHEARHAEQWSHMARTQAATPGMTAAQISANLFVPPGVAASAMAKPLAAGSSSAAVMGQAMHRSVYGGMRPYRDAVLTNLAATPQPPNTYQQYRSLPEEQDAWETGDATGGCGC
jgi:uncharacterized Zn-binding protein involved in type VI secretion